jgi:hypothetical protein
LLLLHAGFDLPHQNAFQTLAGVEAGTGMAVMAVNVLSWLWGI